MLRAGRAVVPPKMTSSISPPRIFLAEFSPMTQRSASTRFDLPQPLGPTMPVRPGSIASSVGSTNDLNPLRRSFEKCTVDSSGLGLRRGQRLVENVVRELADQLGAVDEEGGCRVHAIALLRRVA